MILHQPGWGWFTILILGILICLFALIWVLMTITERIEKRREIEFNKEFTGEFPVIQDGEER